MVKVGGNFAHNFIMEVPEIVQCNSGFSDECLVASGGHMGGKFLSMGHKIVVLFCSLLICPMSTPSMKNLCWL